MSRRGYRRIAFVLVVGVLLAVLVTACGGTDDPYSGTWTGQGNGTFEVKIQKANEGWWSIYVTPEKLHTYGAEINGELQTMNGAVTFKTSGDNLEFNITADKTAPVLLVRK